MTLARSIQERISLLRATVAQMTDEITYYERASASLIGAGNVPVDDWLTSWCGHDNSVNSIVIRSMARRSTSADSSEISGAK